MIHVSTGIIAVVLVRKIHIAEIIVRVAGRRLFFNAENRKKCMKVNILGTKYKIIVEDYNTPGLKDEGCVGYCLFDGKEIHIAVLNTNPDWKNESKRVKNTRTNIILRHEIVHAFLHESGLQQNTHKSGAWAMNEEMIDWIAIQSPKLMEAFKAAGAI